MIIPAHKARDVGNDIYGAARLELAKLVKPVLDNTGLTWYLDGGTLLGAYRDEKQIPHDDDFDIAVYLPNFGEADLATLQTKIASLIPTPYQVRMVTSYAHKLEIFDSTSSTFMLPAQYQGADFHTVTVDIQIMTDAPVGVIYVNDMLGHVHVPKDAITPTGEITCDGHIFNSPHNIVGFLEAQYGYIGTDAVFNSATMRYDKS
ncbi:MAG: LicD family protein [Aestuariibacter sp.]|nr:LicD family protein [Aestuariibacter sp.]